MRTEAIFNMKEKDVVKVCLEYLLFRGHYVWRNNTGVTSDTYMTRDGRVKTRYWKAGIKGSSDIIGIAKDGKFIAVECKRVGGKISDSQIEFMTEIRIRHGYNVLAFGIKELEEAGL